MISLPRIISILFVLIPFLFFSQKGGKEFYLLDSVNYENLSRYDKRILDSILSVYHKEKTDSIRLYQVRLISENLFDQKLWPRYNRLLFRMLEGRKDRFSAVQKGYAYNNFGYEAQYIKNDLFNAKKNYYDALVIFRDYGELNGYGAEINNLAYIYQHEGNIEEAIKLYSEALTVFEKSNNPKGLATEYLNLGDIYFKNNDFQKAEEYFEKALANAKRSNSVSFNSANIEANIYNQLGLVARNKKNSKKAFEWFEKAIKVYETLGDKGKLALVTSNVGEQYFQEKKMREAEHELVKAKSYALQVSDNHVLSRVYNLLGDFYFEAGNIEKAKNNTDSAYHYSKQIGYPDMILSSAKRLAELAEKNNDISSAYTFLKEAYAMRDSIYNDNTRKASIKAQYKTEYEIKEIQKDAQRKSEKQRQQLVTYVVIFAFVGMCVVAVIVYRNYKSKKRSAAVLEDMNHLISEQKKTVEEKQKEVLDSIRYAKRIQQSLLASEKYIQRNIDRLKSKL